MTDAISGLYKRFQKRVAWQRKRGIRVTDETLRIPDCRGWSRYTEAMRLRIWKNSERENARQLETNSLKCVLAFANLEKMFFVDKLSRIVAQFPRAWFQTFVFRGVIRGRPAVLYPFYCGPNLFPFANNCIYTIFAIHYASWGGLAVCNTDPN